MKKLVVLFGITIVIACSSSTKKENLENAKVFNKVSDDTLPRTIVTDSTKWDLVLFNEDITAYDSLKQTHLPIAHIPFPVEKYDSPGNAFVPLKGKLFGRSAVGNLVQSGNDIPFFNILVVTQESPLMNYGGMYSRNYPYDLAQSAIITEIGHVDWIALKTGINKGYAIISAKVFDLSKGKTVLVLPKKDNTLRFMQINETTVGRSIEQRTNFFKVLNEIDEIRNFLK